MIDNEAEGNDSGSDHGFGEDFDDFEEGAVDEDGFGDFDSGFQQPEEQRVEARQPVAMPARIPPSESLFPILDFTKFDTLNDIIEATSTHLDEMFPRTKEACPPAPDPIPEKSTIFLTDRSLSLWSQLVAPPPLQPPNWVRSRIRRLFLVSLGVPVDLDEILPASKQKKLILPSVHLYSSSQSPSSDGRPHGSIARLKQGNENASSASVDSSASPTKTSRKRKGPPPPPELDLAATRMLCSTTDAALLNFTDEKLQLHVTRLEEWTVRASEVLEYWLKRKDDALGDKEAFEGVIENLVKHARKIRK
ncbi:MAG: hypothetical protein FRX48_00574 [Lasallia pustulata]|uniref:Uncharacterized protein n=1 Tax=Lasallia pustulata TaxID=136370 RepID=A0A5M8Q124_9LECA|nr:MAG: hypothetical protein FRX48_00574 [Lasallia pustulata]